MRPFGAPATLSGLLLLLQALQSAFASSHEAHIALQRLEKRHAHRHSHRHAHQTVENATVYASSDLKKRGGQCQFPTDAGLVAVTPNMANGGWAMSPDQPCLPGHFCPYACPPGQLMAQWDPSAQSYSYPASMNGGLKCNDDGSISKPFPNKPYCYDGVGNIKAINNAGGEVAFCQTVLPGNEAMLIPTSVTDSATLAIPDPSYWAGTAAHYYLNEPGTSVVDACVWGDKSKPIGNWSPYVAGGNMDDKGNTFFKVGWNPVYLEPATPFRDVMPSWGVKIECPDGGCNGLPCAIDPAIHKVNECSTSATVGAGGGSFCVVTVPKGSTANIIVFGPDGGSSSSSVSGPQAKAAAHAPSSSSSSSVAPSSTSTSSPSSSSTSSSSSSSSSSTSSSSSSSSSSTTTTSSTSSSSTTTSSRNSTATLGAHLFVESNNTSPSSTFAAVSSMMSASMTTAATSATSSASALQLVVPAAGFLASSFLGLAALM